MRTLALRGLAATLLTALALAALSGCSKKTTSPYANLPPVTRLFLDSAPDTLTYNFRTHWSGDDPDGDIAGFELQLVAGHADPVADAWHFTTSVDSILAPPIGDGAGAYTLYVRAVDNKGLRDPHPASLYLVLRNHRPSVFFFNLPRRLKGGTYHFLPVVTLQWHVSDPEGTSTVKNYHLWLDGGTFDTLLSARDSLFTLRMEHFGDVSTTKTRTVYVAGIDEAAAVSDTISFSWIVDAYTVAPGKRVLLVDDYNVDPSFTNNDTPMDDFYRAAAGTFTGGNYTLLDIFEVEGIRFPQDAQELFRHFDLVVWYNESGTVVPLVTSLNTAEPALARYLDGGGKFFLSHMSVVGQDTLLDQAFDRQYLGVQGAFCSGTGGADGCNYILTGGRTFYAGPPGAPTDSLAVASGFVRGVDLFLPGDSTTSEYYLPQGVLGTADDTTAHVGVVTKFLPYGGRSVFSSIPLYRMDRFSNAAATVQRLFQDLLAVSRPTRFGWIQHRRR